MAFKLFFFAAAIAMACAMPQYHHHEDHHAPAHYKFSYGVHDAHTHDIKNQEETREGDKVQGSYSLLQPDGRQRIVHYTSDKHSGFNAVVEYKGHAAHPQVHHKVVAVPAVHKYVAPVVSHHVAPVVHHATHHVAPIVSHHVAPVVHHATHHVAPVVHHATHHIAPVVAHVAPVVAHVAPASHHGATSSISFVSNHHGHNVHY